MNAARYAYVQLGVRAEDEIDWITSLLWEHGAQGVEECDASTLNAPDNSWPIMLRAHFETEAQAQESCASLQRDHQREAVVAFIEGDDWRHAWKRFFHPLRIGARLVICPSWESVETKPGDQVITIDPGCAFGSGMHASTQLALHCIDKLVKGGERVLDVGCGSAILGIAALKCGASRVDAVDNDPQTWPVARENATINDVDTALTVHETPMQPLPHLDSYDLVVANIESRVLIPMAEWLSQRTNAQGFLVLSGILAEEEERMRNAFKPWFDDISIRQQEGWISLQAKRLKD